MGRIAEILEWLQAVVKDGQTYDETSREGGTGAHTAQNFGAVGVDAQPLPGDSQVEIDCDGTIVAVAYVQTRHANEAGPGEIQVYARNAAGARIVRLQLFADGRTRLWNEAGSLELEAGGDVVINGVRITAAGAIEAPGDVTAGAISLQGHTHGPGSYTVSAAPGSVAGASGVPA